MVSENWGSFRLEQKLFKKNRKQTVKYQSDISDSLTFKGGVPQGSVKRPLVSTMLNFNIIIFERQKYILQKSK